MVRSHAIALLVLLAGCSCNDRTLDEEPPLPDIEGLCQTFCERTFECGEVGGGSIQTVEGCIESCIDRPEWDEPACVEPREALYECLNQYECPEFTNTVICNDDTQPDSRCCPESVASQMCS